MIGLQVPTAANAEEGTHNGFFALVKTVECPLQLIAYAVFYELVIGLYGILVFQHMQQVEGVVTANGQRLVYR